MSGHIHRYPCPRCPSAHYPLDPETEDVLTWPRDQQLDTVFRCAWRSKLCKGYCDLLNVTEADAEAIVLRRIARGKVEWLW